MQLKIKERPTERSLNKGVGLFSLNKKQIGRLVQLPSDGPGTQALSLQCPCLLGQASSSCMSPHGQ